MSNQPLNMTRLQLDVESAVTDALWQTEKK